MKCGWCNNVAVVLMSWKTIGRPKSAPVCATCAQRSDKPDNYGERPVFTLL